MFGPDVKIAAQNYNAPAHGQRVAASINLPGIGLPAEEYFELYIGES
jgi:hypothetical protein